MSPDGEGILPTASGPELQRLLVPRSPDAGPPCRLDSHIPTVVGQFLKIDLSLSLHPPSPLPPPNPHSVHCVHLQVSYWFCFPESPDQHLGPCHFGVTICSWSHTVFWSVFHRVF